MTFRDHFAKMDVVFHLRKMADASAFAKTAETLGARLEDITVRNTTLLVFVVGVKKLVAKWKEFTPMTAPASAPVVG